MRQKKYNHKFNSHMVRYVASTLQCGLYGISTRLMFNLAIVKAMKYMSGALTRFLGRLEIMGFLSVKRVKTQYLAK